MTEASPEALAASRLVRQRQRCIARVERRMDTLHRAEWPMVVRCVRRMLDRRWPGQRDGNAGWAKDRLAETARRGDAQLEQRQRKRAKARADVSRQRKPKVAPEKTRGSIDTIAMLLRRKDITPAEARAAETYRNAWDAAHGSLQGTLNPDRVGGGGSNLGNPPPPAALDGGEVLNRAARILGKLDGAVVQLVVGEGYTIEEAAGRFYGRRPTEAERKRTGARLRESLGALAEGGIGSAGGAGGAGGEGAAKFGRRRQTGWMAPGAKPLAGVSVEVEPGRVAHAERRGVSYSGR